MAIDLHLLPSIVGDVFEKNNSRSFVWLNGAMEEWALIAKIQEHDRLQFGVARAEVLWILYCSVKVEFLGWVCVRTSIHSSRMRTVVGGGCLPRGVSAQGVVSA